MVIISNGSYKFHLAPAAAEAYKRSILDAFITAGYPTRTVKNALEKFRLANSKKIRRLIMRAEELPESLVRPFWSPELFIQLGVLVRMLTGTHRYSEWVQNYGLLLYGRLATSVIRRTSAKIYHYRSGYGHQSVIEAKKKGMIALCDHSIAHPAVLQYLVTNKGMFPEKGKAGPISTLWSNVLKDIELADYILVNSDFVKETFLHQGWSPERIHVIYLGVDQQFMDAVPVRDYPTDHHEPIKLLLAGELGLRKGGEVLVQALQRINDLPWQLEIIGGIDPVLKERFGAFLADPRVKISAFIPRSELSARMSAAEVFVFPSFAEGSARVIFEALACGCYVITTPNSGSIVEDGVHGRLVPPGDIDALETAIRQTIARRETIARVGRSNADLVRSRYQQKQYGDALFDLYTKLLGKPETQTVRDRVHQ